MNTLTVRVANPFLLRGSLEVVLEVARMDLAIAEVEAIRRLIAAVPKSVRPADLSIGVPEARAALLGMRYFGHSRTRSWLREEMLKALRELERALLQDLRNATDAGDAG